MLLPGTSNIHLDLALESSASEALKCPTIGPLTVSVFNSRLKVKVIPSIKDRGAGTKVQGRQKRSGWSVSSTSLSHHHLPPLVDCKVPTPLLELGLECQDSLLET